MNVYRRYSVVALLMALAISASATIAVSKPTSIGAKPSASKACPGCSMVGMNGGAKDDTMGPGSKPMMQMMQTMHPAIAVDVSDVYVLRGNEIIKLHKVGLEVISTTMLPPPSQPTGKMSGMMRNGPGMKGGMNGGMQGDMMGPGGMPMMQMMHPAIAVDESAVYIVRGGEVIKLDKISLLVLVQTTLPTSEPAVGADSMDKIAP